MTIRMLQAWNGLHQQKIVTTLSGSDEAALVAAGIATYDLDGPSENLRMAQLATDGEGRKSLTDGLGTYGLAVVPTGLVFGATVSASVRDANTAAINAAIALAGPNGHVLIPRGEIRVAAGAIVVNVPGLRFSGVARGVWDDATTGSSLICVEDSAASVVEVTAKNVVISDLALRSGYSGKPTQSIGLKMTEAFQCVIRNSLFKGFYECVQFWNNHYWEFRSNHVINPAGVGVRINNLVTSDECDAEFSGNLIYRSSNPFGLGDENGATGVLWESGGGLRMTSNKINAYPNNRWNYCLRYNPNDLVGTGVLLNTGNSYENAVISCVLIDQKSDTAAAGYLRKIVFSGNEISPFVSGAHGIRVKGGATAQAAGKVLDWISITGNSIATAGSPGACVKLEYCSGVVVQGNALHALGGDHVNIGEGVMEYDIQTRNGTGDGTSISHSASANLSRNNTALLVDERWVTDAGGPNGGSAKALWRIMFQSYRAAIIEVTASGQITGKGPCVITQSFVAVRTSGAVYIKGAVTTTVVGDDGTGTWTPLLAFNNSISSDAMTISIQHSESGGSWRFTGNASITVKGPVYALSRQ